MYSGNLSLSVTFYFWHLEICQSFSHVCVCVWSLFRSLFTCYSALDVLFLFCFWLSFISYSFLLSLLFCLLYIFSFSALVLLSSVWFATISWLLSSYAFFVIYRHPWTFIVTKGDVTSVVEDTAVYQGRNLFCFLKKPNPAASMILMGYDRIKAFFIQKSQQVLCYSTNSICCNRD